MLKDGIVLYDGNNRIIFNQHSLCELVKHLLIHYAGISYEEAAKTVEESPLAEPISNAIEAVLFGHEYPYFWAMHIYYGNMYWEKGIPAQPDDLDAYFELENSIIRKYGLRYPIE